jgi:hypothetical protein
MPEYRFVGREVEIGGRRLWFGEPITLSDTAAEDMIAGRSAVKLLPAEDFEKLKFTPEELSKYKTPTSRDVLADSKAVATSDIRARMKAATEAADDHRTKLLAAREKSAKAAERKKETGRGD